MCIYTRRSITANLLMNPLNSGAATETQWQKPQATKGFFPTKDRQTPHLSFDPVFMDDAQCAETNENSIFRFFRYLFFKLSWKFIENWGDLSTKMTITRKIKIGNIWNLIFLSIQLIPHLSCKFEHVWKKIPPPPKCIQRPGFF